MVDDQLPSDTSTNCNIGSTGNTSSSVKSRQDNKASNTSRLSTCQCWNNQRPWVKIIIYLLPIIGILLIAVILLAIFLGITRTKNYDSAACTSPQCIRAAIRIIDAMNMSIDPCDNFYDYACGGFAQREEIPPGLTEINQFNKRQEIVFNQLKLAIEKPLFPDDPVVKKVRTFYQSCLDTASIELNGLPRLRKMVEDLGGFAFDDRSVTRPEQWSLEDAVTRRTRYTISGIFQIEIGLDFFDNSKNIIYLTPSSLGLGARDFYVDKSVKQDPLILAYTQLLHAYAQLITGSKTIALSAIVDVVTLEQKLATLQPSLQTFLKMNLDTLYQTAPYIKWDRFLSSVMAVIDAQSKIGPDKEVLVVNVPYFTNLTNLLNEYTKTQSGIKTLQNYLVLLAVLQYAPRLGSDFEKAYLKSQHPEPLLNCLGDANEKLAFPVAKAYLDRFSSIDHIPLVITLITDVHNAYRELIASADWMDEATRLNALNKHDAMKFDVAFPQWLRNSSYVLENYVNFNITDDYTANLFEYYNYSIRTALKSYGKRPDLTRWSLAPQTANGIYDHTRNKLFVTAALLGEPFFYTTPGMPEALSYGSLGAVTGHEIAHGFDILGRAFDKFGNYKNWWSSEITETYQKHAECFVKQYDGYVIESSQVDGKLTLNENMADWSGLRSAFLAYKRAQNEGRISGIAGRLPGLDLNDDQLVFLSFAQTYCTNVTKEALSIQAASSDHAPNAMRVVGTLSNSADFARTFQCKTGTAMNPKEKCYVW